MTAEAVPPPAADEPVRVLVEGRLAPDVVDRVDALLAAATEADGVQPLSEHVWLHLRHGGEGPDQNLLVVLPGRGEDSGEIAGYAHLDPTDPVAGPSAEVVVHPDHRGRGLGRLLVEATLQRDYPVIAGVVLYAGAVFAVISLIVDLLYAVIDPRIRLASDP